MSIKDWLYGKETVYEKKKRKELEEKKANKIKLKEEKKRKELEEKKANKIKLKEINKKLEEENTELEALILIKEKKETYDDIYPEIKQHIQHKASSGVLGRKKQQVNIKIDQLSFTEDIFEKIGNPENRTWEGLRIVRNIIPELKIILKNTIIADNREDLKKISILSIRYQRKFIITIMMMIIEGTLIKSYEQIYQKHKKNKKTKEKNSKFEKKNIELKKKIKELDKIIKINIIKLKAWEQYPLMLEVVLKLAKEYGWTESKGFPKKTDLANQYRKAWEETAGYIILRGLRMEYVIIVNDGKLVDEDTGEEIIDPHDAHLCHVSTGTWHPKSTIMFDYVKIKHKDNHVF